MESSVYLKTALPGLHEGMLYTHFFHHLHRTLKPNSYFEIGTEKGTCIEFVTCDVVCVDPCFQIDRDIFKNKSALQMYQMTSDHFFTKPYLANAFPAGPDISFLDGMHRFEYLLRDFSNTEKLCHPRSLIFLHDCLPQNERMTRRVHVNGPEEEGGTRFAWTGDVWKLMPILKKYRPDLRVFYLDCPPTGLVAISRIDPSSAVLSQNYFEIVDEFRNLSLDDYGLQNLWDAFPMLDTQALHKNDQDLTTYLNIY
jgi:hypothetical protein